MTDVYLASPRSQQQCEHATGHNVLLSFATWAGWIERYAQGFNRIILDSGAFSTLNSGKRIDVEEYARWASSWGDSIEAYAGLDDIRGDWEQSLKNYQHGGFPTFHDSDPPKLLDDLLELAEKRGGWIGIGLVPPREGKRDFIVQTLKRIPPRFHVHGWALRRYADLRRFDSIDSTNWWRSAMELRSRFGLSWLNYGECLDLQIKRIVRENRAPKFDLPEETQKDLFS